MVSGKFVKKKRKKRGKHLKNYAHETDDELVKKILKRLEKAAADAELLRNLDLEEIVDDAFEKMEKTIFEQHQVIDKQEQLIKELKQKLKDNK